MTTISVNRTKFTLAPGQVEHFPQGGAEIFCYTLTGGDEIDVALDAGEYLPFARSMGYKQPHSSFKLYNPSGAAVTGELLQANVAGVLDDRRELAAQVAVDGGIITNTAPLTDQGGTIRKLGSSLYSAGHDRTALGTLTTAIVAAASNTNGLRIRTAFFNMTTAAATSNSSLWVETAAGTLIGQIFTTVNETGIIWMPDEWHVPANHKLVLHVIGGTNCWFEMNYDIL